MPFEYHVDGTCPPKDDGWVFVFGSNLSGIHGAGAAREARLNWGAELGVSIGRCGNSYAIPTKDAQIARTLSMNEISQYVNEFIDYAYEYPEVKFWITRVGCGLAGLSDRKIASLFQLAPSNCNFPIQWSQFIDA